MTAQDHQETPTTAAGRQFIEDHGTGKRREIIAIEVEAYDLGWADGCSGPCMDASDAIEAEAAARQVTELRAAVEAWPESWTRTIGAKFVRNRILDLLSAGDKAEPVNPRLGGPYLDDRTDLDGPLSAGDKAKAPHKLLFPPHPDGFYGSSALCSCGFFQWDGETAESVLAAQAMVTADWQTHVAGDKAEAPHVTSEEYRAKSGDWGRD